MAEINDSVESRRAAVVRAAIDGSGWPHGALAQALGVSKSALSHTLARPMTQETMNKLLEALANLPSGHQTVDCPYGDWRGRRFALASHLEHWHR